MKLENIPWKQERYDTNQNYAQWHN